MAIAVLLGCTPAAPREAAVPEPAVSPRHLAAVASAVEIDRPPVVLEDFARGVRMHVTPPGIQIDIPEQISGVAYLDDDLRRVEACSGRAWDPEFAAVTAAALPFERLVAHVGVEEFCGGVSYGDAHIRVYVLDDGVETVARSIAQRGDAAIRELTGFAQPEEWPVEPAWAAKWRSKLPSDWTRVKLRYDRFYIDYGARAYVETFLERFATKTIAIVFWKTSTLVRWTYGVREDPQAELLESVRLTSDTS
jgi:hypothetical protein